MTVGQPSALVAVPRRITLAGQEELPALRQAIQRAMDIPLVLQTSLQDRIPQRLQMKMDVKNTYRNHTVGPKHVDHRNLRVDPTCYSGTDGSISVSNTGGQTPCLTHGVPKHR